MQYKVPVLTKNISVYLYKVFRTTKKIVLQAIKFQQLKKRIHISLYLLLLIISALLILCLLFGWAVWHQSNGGTRLGKSGPYITKLAEWPNAIFEKTEVKSPLWKKNKTAQTGNFFIKNNIQDSGFVLMACYDNKYNQFVIKIFSIQQQRIIHTWIPDLTVLKSLNKKYGSDIEASLLEAISFKTQHPILTADTGIIFKGEYGLIKLNKASKVEWYTAGKYHHSIEKDFEGNYWTAGYISPTALNPTLFPNIKDDAIVKFSATGKVLFKKSIASILIENNAMYLLTGIGQYEEDPIHSNDVEPVLYNSAHWQQGDIFISIRNRSTILLYNPNTNKIKWMQTGPWSNQHDISIIDSNRIGVFGNDIVRLEKKRFMLTKGYNSFYTYSFADKKTDTPFNKIFIDHNIATKSEGRVKLLDNGDLFIEETNYGRVMRVNNNGIKWCYMETLDKKTVSIMGWSRYYSTLPW